MAQTPTPFGRLLSVLRSQRDYVPSTLTFPQLDVAAMTERLRLTDRAEENGKEDEPPSGASQPDRVEAETAEIVQEEYSRAVDIYRQGLENYDRRIHGTAIETLGVEIVGAANRVVVGDDAELRSDLCEVRDINWISYALLESPIRAAVRSPAPS